MLLISTPSTLHSNRFPAMGQLGKMIGKAELTHKPHWNMGFHNVEITSEPVFLLNMALQVSPQGCIFGHQNLYINKCSFYYLSVTQFREFLSVQEDYSSWKVLLFLAEIQLVYSYMQCSLKKKIDLQEGSLQVALERPSSTY